MKAKSGTSSHSRHKIVRWLGFVYSPRTFLFGCLGVWLWNPSFAQVVPDIGPGPTAKDRDYTLPGGFPIGNGSIGLVVIVHGWQDNAAVSVLNPPTDNSRPYSLTADGWVPRLKDQLAARLPNKWDIWMYDWSKDAVAAAPEIKDLDTALKNFENTAPKALGHGQYLAAQIVKANQYEHVHFIAHSLGSLLIDTATINLKKNAPNIKIHETFLDGPDPSGKGFLVPPLKGWDWSGVFGGKADLAEHCFKDDGANGIPFLGIPYKKAYNIDLTAINPYALPAPVLAKAQADYQAAQLAYANCNGIADCAAKLATLTTAGNTLLTCINNAAERHRWPREWYELGVPGNAGNPAGANPPPKTDPVPKSTYDNIGYGLSREVRDLDAGGKAWPPASFDKGMRRGVKNYNATNKAYDLTDGTKVTLIDQPRHPAVGELLGRRIGTVSVTPDTAVTNVISAGSSITLTADDTNVASLVIIVGTTGAGGEVNAMTFNYIFDGPRAFGLNGLSIYQPDDTGTNWADVYDGFQQFAANDGSWESGHVSFDRLAPGQYAFAFGMDSYPGLSSTVTITNLQFRFTATGPMVFANPTVTALNFTAGGFQFSFQSADQCGYLVEFVDSLGDSWDTLVGVTGDGTVLTITDTNAPTSSRFYRVRVQ